MRHRLETFLLLALVLAQPAPAASLLAWLRGEQGLCVGVAGQPAESAPLAFETCGQDAADHYWFLPPRGYSGAIYTLGLCLDGSGGSAHLASCAPSFAQQWRHEIDGRLVAVDRDLCLDAAQGFALAPCTGAPSQAFLAEGQGAWTPRLSNDRSALMPIPSADPDIWYGRNAFGLLRSENGARSFNYMRDFSSSAGFAISPFGSSLVWTASRGRLERSYDGGLSWTTVADLQPILSGTSITIAPSQRDPQRVYVYALKLMASKDGGRTFELRGTLPDHRTGASQLYDAGEGSLLYMNVEHCLFACNAENVGLWRSDDDGASWQRVLQRESAVGAAKLLDDPREPQTFFLTSRRSGESFGVLERSVDGGRTFSTVGPLPSSDGKLHRFAGETQTFYLHENEKLWRSPDLGATWEELVSPLAGLAPWDSQLTVFYDGRLRLSVLLLDEAGFAAEYFDSEDRGESFGRMEPVGNGKINSVPLPVAFTSQPNRFYYLDGRKLLRTDDRGFSWHEGGQLDDPEVILADPRNPDRVLAIARSVLWRSEDSGASFAPALPVQATALAAFDDGVRSTILAASPLLFHRSFDGGRNWSVAPSPDPERLFKKLVITESAIFAVSEHDQLYRSLDGGETYERVNVAEKSLAAAAGLVAYLRFDGSSIRVSEDGGLNFVDRFPPDTFSGGSGLSIDAQGTLYVAGETTVLRSRDRGRTWISIGRDLIGAAGVGGQVVADPFDPVRLYHSGSLGLQFGRWHDLSPLELLGGRFEARVIWRDYRGQIGQGIASTVTGDTGLFWLFTPERSEVSVKVLDGRAINGRFWVFVGAMTDVELDIEVEDRLTNQIWTYHNPLGNFLSFGDIEAFPRNGGQPQPAAMAGPARGGVLLGTEPSVLVGDRFEVSVDWSTATGSGAGQGRLLKGDTAAFYFFSPANVELLVNVLDGRPINGKFWVYFGSMSDVEYTVSVKDRVSGKTKTYFNPAGRFASLGDSQAFD